MDQALKLFPESELYAPEPVEENGIYEREANGHRWLKPRSRVQLKRPSSAVESAQLWLTLGGPSWVASAWVAVRVNGAFCGVAEVDGYKDHYFPLPALPQSSEVDVLTVELEVLNDLSGCPDSRELAIALYGGGVGSSDAELPDRSESFVLLEQLRVLTGNPPFAGMLDSYSREPAVALELGGGNGVLSGLVAAKTAAEVWCLDMTNYNSAGFPSARTNLQGMLMRGQRLAAEILRIPADAIAGAEEQVTFLRCSAEDLALRDEFIDFAFSLNAFEHIGDPAKALAELKRVLKPGGAAYLQFSPVYMCDAGSHLWDQGLLDVPWCVLLHTREEIHDMIKARGASTHRVDEILDSLNGRSTQYYRDVFAECGMAIESYEEIKGCVIPGADGSEEFHRAAAMYPADDLRILGFKVLLRKPGGAGPNIEA